MAAQRGSPRAASYFHISDNLYIKFDNNDKKGNLGNQWQSLISSPLFPPLHVCKIFAALLRGQNFLCLKDSLGKTFGASRDIVITAPVGDVPKNQWYNCFRLSHKERQIFGSLLQLREGFTKKSSCSFGFCPNYLFPTPPTPQFGQLVPLSFNAKNVDLRNIQNDSLSKILFK